MSHDAYQTAVALVNGAVILASLLVGLFFLRYWKSTRDRLFLIFAVAFAVLAANRTALAFLADDETRTYIYWLRLLAFLLILVAIIDKNRSRA